MYNRIYLTWRSSNFRKALYLLNKDARNKLIFVVASQILLGFLDLIGVAALGVLGALSIVGIRSGTPGNRVSEVLDILHISKFSVNHQISILGIAAVVLLFSRTFLSISFTRRTLYFLSDKAARSSAELTEKLLEQPLYVIQSRSSQETLYAVTNGVSALLLGVVGAAANMVADGALLLILMAGLFIVDPYMTFGLFCFFSLISYGTYRLLKNRVRGLSAKNVNLTIKSSEKLLEVLATYREAIVRSRRTYYAKYISSIRSELGDVYAENSFIPYISKYAAEITIILSALIISVVQFFYYDISRAVGTLTVFLAAGTRIAPAMLRLQQALLGIKSNLSSAKPTLDFMDSVVKNDSMKENEGANILIDADFFEPIVKVNKISFKYEESSKNTISDVSFTIQVGELTAVVGPTGAGKTTLIDLILGIHDTQSGTIEISGLAPSVAISKWPGKIGYAPQNTVITRGTILQNVALGFPDEEIDVPKVLKVLNIAKLDEFIRDLPNGIYTLVGENGAKLSGGQRQRLGIARALYTNPKLLVLDEATSSLDGETELAISDSISGLDQDVTVLIIAHRLSTVRSATKVLYMENGELVAQGNFEEVRMKVPNFDKQAKLMGL